MRTIEENAVRLNRSERRRLGEMFKVDLSKISVYMTESMKLMEKASATVSNLKPSEWCEQNRTMTPEVSPLPGPFSYNNAPYAREIVDCLDPSHPAKIIAIMKGAQIGISVGVIEAGIGYIIANNPGNIMYLVGHDDLVEKAVNKIDQMLDNSTCSIENKKPLRSLIKSASKRARNAKTGDTDRMKEFPQGQLQLGSANHKLLRQVSMQFGFFDDFDAMVAESKQSGSTTELIEQRFAAYDEKMKIMYISTPELEETSNIQPVYLMGDQRKYHIPCPCCNELITIEWEVVSEKNPEEKAGIYWELDAKGKLLKDSVGYICQKCGGFFDDSNKGELLRSGKWIATAEPAEPGYVSFHISSLYAPPYMFKWEKYVRKWLRIHPPGSARKEGAYKTFVTTILGLPYKAAARSISATELQRNNVRDYEIGYIPEKLSLADGNGRIVMITCGSDLNGNEDDARLDYEIVAHSESGATYSMLHGSIGTFIPRDKHPERREQFTYRHGAFNSVWPAFKEIIKAKYYRDTDGSSMKIFITGVDTGHMKEHAYPFVDNFDGGFVVSLKGDPTKKIKPNADLKTFKPSRENPKLYLVESNYTKDILAEQMGLNWNPDYQESQPLGFMNFPAPNEGLYQYKNYFSHFEAEHKVVDKNGAYVWEKKNSNSQNHIFDCRLYAMVVRDIFITKIFKEAKVINGTWPDYVNLINPK